MIDHTRITQWLRMELYKDHKAGPIARFSVRHIANAKLGSEILELSTGEGFDDTWIATAVADIETHVEMDAGGLGGLQAYCLLAFRGQDGDKQEKSTGRYTFRVSADDDALGDDGVTSEPATKNGIVAQAMRHTEAMMRATTLAIGQVVANQSRTIDRIAGENDALHRNQAKVYELLEELQNRGHERALEIRKVELKERMTEAVVDKVALLLPAVVNKVVGKPVLPETVNPTVETIKQFMISLTQEQMERLLPVLTPEQQIALGLVVNGFQQDNGKGTMQ